MSKYVIISGCFLTLRFLALMLELLQPFMAILKSNAISFVTHPVLVKLKMALQKKQ